jgi:hypothetical protein
MHHEQHKSSEQSDSRLPVTPGKRGVAIRPPVQRMYGPQYAVVQRMGYDEISVGKYYNVTGYEYPLYLRKKSKLNGFAATFHLDTGASPSINITDDSLITEQVDVADEQAYDNTPGKLTLGAIWDAYNRVSRVIELITPYVTGAKAVNPHSDFGKIVIREGLEFWEPFLANLVKISAYLKTEAAQSSSLKREAKPDSESGIGEIANTDIQSGKITFLKPFYTTLDRLQRSDTATHESVHAALKVEDQAYKWTRIFPFLVAAKKLENPDSYVSLLREIDPQSPELVQEENLVIAPDVAVPEAKAQYHLGLAQNIGQRAAYFLAAAVSELSTRGLVAAFQRGKPVTAFINTFGDSQKEKIYNGQTTPGTLAGWANTYKLYALSIAAGLKSKVTITGTTDSEGHAGWDLSGDNPGLTYNSTVGDPVKWLIEKYFTVKGFQSPASSATRIINFVKAVDSQDGKFKAPD